MVDAIENEPAAHRRRRNCQKFLLYDVRRHGSVDRALANLVGLHDTDPAWYARLTLTARLFAPRTFRGYWAELPRSKRLNARRTGAARRLRRARSLPAIRGRDAQAGSP
ncbi:MAG: hypothetical protein QOH16_672 [Gaiellaceae bacterium]|nr:hypothetical protein [Gaiellaceae bacterium]